MWKSKLQKYLSMGAHQAKYREILEITNILEACLEKEISKSIRQQITLNILQEKISKIFLSKIYKKGKKYCFHSVLPNSILQLLTCLFDHI